MSPYFGIRLAVPTATALLLSAGPAFAHGGHLGELAGHSHWAGVAALAGAAAVAALAAKLRARRNSKNGGSADEASDAEQAGATAEPEAAQ